MRIESISKHTEILLIAAVVTVCVGWNRFTARYSPNVAASIPIVASNNPQPLKNTEIGENETSTRDLSDSVSPPNRAATSTQALRNAAHVQSSKIAIAKSEPPETYAINSWTPSPVKLETAVDMPNMPAAALQPVVAPRMLRVGVFTGFKPIAAVRANSQTILGEFGDLRANADMAPRHPVMAVAVGIFGVPSADVLVNESGTHRLEHGQLQPIHFGNGGIGGNGVQVAAANRDAVVTLPVVLSELQARYTSQAEEARVQGEVTLKVRFLASGQVNVIGIVNGLGYGLDEEARRVAETIHFKPALRNGQPVDHTTFIHVTFQLA